MKPYKWRTISATARYVDSDTGSDLFGDGSQQNPFKTLRKAYNYTPTKPAQIICRGLFSEDMADGNHGCYIDGDYLGAATFDGQDAYLIYGFSHRNMIIRNCAEGSSSNVVYTATGLYAGVGRAAHARVGHANAIYGVYGSPNIIDRSGLYFGGIGGSAINSGNTYSKLKCNDTYLLGFAFYSNETLRSNTFYGVKFGKRRKCLTATGGTITSAIFGDFDIFADDNKVTLHNCLILADCKWYYNGNEIVLSGATPEARQQSLIDAMGNLGITENNRIILDNCKFSLQTSDVVFNNPENMDFTVKVDSDAVKAPGVYYGALQPAIDVPILDDSSEEVGTWDEKTATGFLIIDDNGICVDSTSQEKSGSLYSKVIKIDPTKVNINGVFTDFSSKFSNHGAYLWDESLVDVEYEEGDLLPIGRFIVKGVIVYDNLNLGDGSILVVGEENTNFIDNNVDSKVIAIQDTNLSNAVYVRFTAMSYVRIESSDGLEAGGVYLNITAENITYRGRTIVPNESFIAENSIDTFTHPTNKKIGVMFDDSRVPHQDWIPVQLLGEYFAWYDAGVLQTDSDGVPISSGNYLSYQTSANGGFSNVLGKSIGNKAFFQLKVEVKRV